MATKYSLVANYFRSQIELGMPSDFVLGEKFNFTKISFKTEKNDDKNIKTKVLQEENPSIHETVLKTQTEQTQDTDKRDELAKLYYKSKNCTACSLSNTRKNFVFGAGTAYTDIMVIGEAPGEQEDLQGKPFVGTAGELLTKMLAAIHLERKEIFIANILKCRPPNNRDPQLQEINSCLPLLKKQIEIIKPIAILLLGRFAANTILQTTKPKSVGSLRGIVHYYNDIPAVVSYHPSALLRDASYKKPAWDDLQKFEKLVKEIRNA